VEGATVEGATVEGATLAELLRFGGWVSLNALLSPVLGYMDRVILAGVAGVAAVGRYVPPWEAIVRLGLVPASVMTALVPVFSALDEVRNPANVRRLAIRSAGSILLLTGVPALVAALWATPLLSLWLGEAFHPEGAAALRILSVGVVLNALGFVPLGLLQAVGRPELPAILQIAEIPFQLALAWFLISRFGIPGAAMAWSLRCGVDAVALWLLALRATRSDGTPVRARVA
jgi:O-antigen/teichoic acid export membrane protein